MGTTKSMSDWLSLLEAAERAVAPDSIPSEDVPTSVTIATVAGPTTEVFAETPPPSAEVVSVAYQRIFFDWAIADGTYTPQQLRKAKVAVKAWGPVLTYSLTVERDSAC